MVTVKVWGSIPAATKIVRYKNLALNIGECVSVARIPRKAVGPMYIRRVIPEHVKYPRAPVDKGINTRRHWSMYPIMRYYDVLNIKGDNVFIQNHILSLAVQCHLFAYVVHISTLIMKATLLTFLVLFLVLLNTAESSRTLF